MPTKQINWKQRERRMRARYQKKVWTTGIVAAIVGLIVGFVLHAVFFGVEDQVAMPVAQPTPEVRTVYITPEPTTQTTPETVYITPEPAAEVTPQIIYITPEPTAEPTPEPTPEESFPTWQDLQRTLYETDSCGAALYLGRSSAASLAEALPQLLSQNGLDGVAYLTGIDERSCVDYYGDEVFILIPRGDRSLSIYNYILKEDADNYDAYGGALLYSSAEGNAMAVRCNESDVRPNLLAVFTGFDGERKFSPRITLSDESLLAADGIYALTPPGENG